MNLNFQTRFVSLVLLAAWNWVGTTAHAEVIREIEYARIGERKLTLDMHRPDGKPHSPLIVWVHGGAWRGGSRSGVELKGLTTLGWAVASVDYRLSTQARFPAQIHDIKAAIRYLRARAGEYGWPANRIIIAGSSAGGHLAALVGVTNGLAALEGTVGDNRAVSSDVQAIVDLYGASNLTTILAQSTPHGLSVRVPALDLLLGGQPDKVPELAQLASPVFQLDAHDPPLFLMHGDKDPQMPIEQSREFLAAYRKLGLSVQFTVQPGSGHGGPAFTTAVSLQQIDDFLRQQLKI